MKFIKENKLLSIAYLCLAVSVLSLFIPIVTYSTYNFNLISLITDPGRFNSLVLEHYTGAVVWDIGTAEIVAFIIIGLAAFVCAIVGLLFLSKQKTKVWPFVLAVIGLAGTMLPSVMIFIGVALSANSFEDTMSCGPYPIITPIAMVVSVIVTSAQFRRNRKYEKDLQKLKEEGKLFTRSSL